MTERLDLYKCNICGNLVEVVLSGVGELVCCGEPMDYLEAKTQDSEYGEKHVPVLMHKSDDCVEIRVGSQLHPMVEEHYIQFIEVYPRDKTQLHLKFLNPNDKAEFEITNFAEDIDALEYCNIHGLWRNIDD